MSTYFFIGMFSTLSFHTLMTQLADNLLAGVVSLLGGILSSVVVAWLKQYWGRARK